MRKRIIYTKISLIICAMLIANANVFSQCKVRNDFFQSGEVTEYDLYIKWGLLSSKGGSAKMVTQSATYEGENAYKMTMTSSSKGAARKVFKLDDTLSCYTTKELVPLAYLKDAHEGDDYTKERVKYTYTNDGKVLVNAVRHKNGEFRFDENIYFDSCTYDLMSVVFYARTLDYTQMKNGKHVTIDFVSGKKKLNMQIKYDGTETIRANDDVKYECIKLTLKISDNAFEDEKESMKVWLTNDSNRMIVRMDSKLKVGSTRALLKSYKGNKHPVRTKK